MKNIPHIPKPTPAGKWASKTILVPRKVYSSMWTLDEATEDNGQRISPRKENKKLPCGLSKELHPLPGKGSTQFLLICVGNSLLSLLNGNSNCGYYVVGKRLLVF